jgi:hypothetical protein
MWSPKGMVTYTRRDGSLELNGYPGKVAPTQVIEADSPLRVNRKGQIAFPVRLEPEGSAILLATPNGGVR